MKVLVVVNVWEKHVSQSVTKFKFNKLESLLARALV